MKIQYASDLHLELRDNMNYIKNNPLPIVGDILVLAGDIYYLDNPSITHLQFWDWCADHFHIPLWYLAITSTTTIATSRSEGIRGTGC